MTAISSRFTHATASQVEAVVPSVGLLRGEILLQTKSHSAWGGAVTAQMYLPLARAEVWHQLIDYPRWVDYFPSLTQSKLLEDADATRSGSRSKRLYQRAGKEFLCFSAQVEIYLRVFEQQQQRIQFCMESGHFTDFYADLWLQDCQAGTVLSYAVQATPTIPVPSLFIQHAIQLDLPNNMRHMRQVLCDRTP
jgi:hypothetical protein